MSLGEIISNAIRYPFNDIAKFIIVGIIAVLAGLVNIVGGFNSDSFIIGALAVLISFIFAIVLSGYGLTVIKKGIEHSDEIPNVNILGNFIDGIKVIIVGIVYMIIPIVITLIFGFITGAIGKGLGHGFMALGFAGIISIVISILFGIFEVVALARLGDTDSLAAALSIGDVIGDAKRIGIFNILAFLIVAIIIIIIAYVIICLLSLIPYIGVIIASLVAGAFVTLFYNKALGLLYAQA